MTHSAAHIAERIIASAASRGVTIAVAESLTGGLVASALVAVPGASSVVRLGVVAYATPMKSAVLGVPADLLAVRGAVDADVAMHMARGVRELANTAESPCTLAVATTGVAGPDAQDGHPPGEFHLGFCTLSGNGDPHPVWATSHAHPGDRDAVRAAALHAALSGLEEAILDRTP